MHEPLFATRAAALAGGRDAVTEVLASIPPAAVHDIRVRVRDVTAPALTIDHGGGALPELAVTTVLLCVWSRAELHAGVWHEVGHLQQWLGAVNALQTLRRLAATERFSAAAAAHATRAVRWWAELDADVRAVAGGVPPGVAVGGLSRAIAASRSAGVPTEWDGPDPLMTARHPPLGMRAEVMAGAAAGGPAVAPAAARELVALVEERAATERDPAAARDVLHGGALLARVVDAGAARRLLDRAATLGARPRPVTALR